MLFFTHATRIVAFLAFAIGLIDLFMGFGIAFRWIGPSYEEALRLYTTETTSGAVINKGTVRILIAVALGTLAEISLSLRKRAITE